MTIKNQFDPNDLKWLQIVQKQVAAIRFGVVQLTVHNGEVVQIERTEKTRIGNSASNPNTDQQGASGKPRKA